MRAEGRHEWLEMEVIKTSATEEGSEYALAVSPSIFREFAREPGYEIPVPAAIGQIVLREGMMLEAYGNTGAHDGSEVQPVDITIRREDD